MEVIYWEGGLLRHEVEAIEAMEKAFKCIDPLDASQATNFRRTRSHHQIGLMMEVPALSCLYEQVSHFCCWRFAFKVQSGIL